MASDPKRSTGESEDEPAARVGRLSDGLVLHGHGFIFERPSSLEDARRDPSVPCWPGDLGLPLAPNGETPISHPNIAMRNPVFRISATANPFAVAYVSRARHEIMDCYSQYRDALDPVAAADAYAEVMSALDRFARAHGAE